ncbi:MAG TPA: hypothetical protein VK929_15990 [Longimicrobiales bacterium]|nr:hypothetical protein [Longimicrobiales bacterium]
MTRTFVRLLPVATLLATLAVAPRPASGQATCTYDTCALRIQPPTLTTPLMLVRGVEGEEVIKLGLLEPEVAPFVALSDTAAALARIYDVQYDRGYILNMAGTVIAIGAPILLQGTMQKLAFTGAGVGLSFYGGVLMNRANDALNRALWWYNRELPR